MCAADAHSAIGVGGRGSRLQLVFFARDAIRTLPQVRDDLLPGARALPLERLFRTDRLWLSRRPCEGFVDQVVIFHGAVEVIRAAMIGASSFLNSGVVLLEQKPGALDQAAPHPEQLQHLRRFLEARKRSFDRTLQVIG